MYIKHNIDLTFFYTICIFLRVFKKNFYQILQLQLQKWQFKFFLRINVNYFTKNQGISVIISFSTHFLLKLKGLKRLMLSSEWFCIVCGCQPKWN